MTTVLAAALVVLSAAALVLSAVSLVLHKWAPTWRGTADIDALRKDIDEIKALLPSQPAPSNKQSGRASMTLVALLALFAVVGCSFVGCGASQRAALKTLGHCEETAAVKDLEGPVKQLGDDFLAGKLTKADAFAILDSYAASYGLDTLGCAVTFVGQLFATKVSGSRGAVDLYNEWLAKHGYVGKQASADESFREAERNFAEAEKRIDDATARISQMRAELSSASPCDSGVLSVDAYGRLSCANGIAGDGAVGALAISTNHALSGSGAPCESPNFMPVVNCGDGVMSYDGCRWACDYTMAGMTITGRAFISPTEKP